MSVPEPCPAPETARSFWSRWHKPLLFIAALLLLFVLAQGLGWGASLSRIQPWMASLGPWAPLAFIGVYILASVLAVPGTALTLLAPVLFGAFWGLIWVSLASTAAAAVCFLIARYLSRQAIQTALVANPHFQRLERLSARHGVWMVALTRLLPVFPFNLLNYAFGLSNVPFFTYVFWSWLCMLPGTALYVVGIDTLQQALATRQVPWLGLLLLGVLLLGLVVTGRLARRKMQRFEQEQV